MRPSSIDTRGGRGAAADVQRRDGLVGRDHAVLGFVRAERAEGVGLDQHLLRAGVRPDHGDLLALQRERC